jgi:hypothetical protein
MSEDEFIHAIRNKSNPEHRWALIRLFTICPTNKLFSYITADDFLEIWPELRDTVEEDFWGRARVEKLDWLYNFLLKAKTKSSF